VLAFSVVIPTRSRPRQLATCLAAIARLDYPRDRFEVIVVDDGGRAPLGGALAAARGVDLVLERQAHSGPASARNRGARRARGRYVAFTDDDCEPPRGWLRELEAPLSSGATAAVGRSLNGAPDNAFSTAGELVTDYLYERYNHCRDDARFGTTSNLAIDRGTFIALGGFDEAFTWPGGEDRELVHRVRVRGGKIVCVPEAPVRHVSRQSLRGFWRKHYVYGRGAALFRRRAEHVDAEPLSFYAELLRYPRLRSAARPRLVALVALSQIATVAGFAHEALLPTRRS
jgi:glycosyltransferase involved in cell wall biosynthesis